MKYENYNVYTFVDPNSNIGQTLTSNGTTITSIDTVRAEADDYFNNMYIYYRTGANVGLARLITDWDNASHTFTHEAFPNNTALGDRYSLSKHIDHYSNRSENAYMYKNLGVGFVDGDFIHYVDIMCDDAEVYNQHSVWGLETVLGAMWMNPSSGYYICVSPYFGVNNTQYMMMLYEYDGSQYSAQGTINKYSIDTWYYLIIDRTGPILRVRVYSNAARTNLLETVTLVLHNIRAYQYLVASATTYNASSTRRAHWRIEKLGNTVETVTGVTRDSTGAALGNCTVLAYKIDNNCYTAATTTSDSNGNYSVTIKNCCPNGYFMVAYKTGSPNVQGVTDRNVVGT